MVNTSRLIDFSALFAQQYTAMNVSENENRQATHSTECARKKYEVLLFLSEGYVKILYTKNLPKACGEQLSYSLCCRFFLCSSIKAFKSLLLILYSLVPIGIVASSPNCTHFRTVFMLTFIILATSSAVSISSSFIGPYSTCTVCHIIRVYLCRVNSRLHFFSRPL